MDFMSPRRSLALVLAFLCLALGLVPARGVAAAAEEPAIIAKARAFVGDEATLQGLRTIRFTGTLTMSDPAVPAKERSIKLDVVFAKPGQQLMRMTFENQIETTGLDGFEAWQLVQDKANPTRQRLTILPPARIRRLRAETWENLFYYRGIESVGGKMEDDGTFTVDGVLCRKFNFIHSPTVIFRRYFKPDTGQLVITETEDGRVIREEGEIVVQGLRFPTKVTTLSKDDKGVVNDVVLTFDKITINETLPPKYFAVPTPAAPTPAPPAP